MTRRKQSAAAFMDAHAAQVTLILGDMVEHLGEALVAWSQAVMAIEVGDYDTALARVVDVEIGCDVPLRVGRSEIKSITRRAANLLEAELPDDDDEREPPA